MALIVKTVLIEEIKFIIKMADINEMSECDYLESQYFEDVVIDVNAYTNQLKTNYNFNNKAKVGQKLICPICGREFKKKVPQQAFCFTKCKDKFWNFVDQKRFMRMHRSKY